MYIIKAERYAPGRIRKNRKELEALASEKPFAEVLNGHVQVDISDAPADIHYVDHGLYVVSQRAKNLFEKLNLASSYCPATLKKDDGTRYKKYAVFSPTHVLDIPIVAISNILRERMMFAWFGGSRCCNQETFRCFEISSCGHWSSAMNEPSRR